MRLNMTDGCTGSSSGEKPEAAWDAPLVAEDNLITTTLNHPLHVLLALLDQPSSHCPVNQAFSYSVPFFVFKRKIRIIAEAM